MGRNQRAQIVMTDDEVRRFLEQQRTATLVTVGPDGHPHAVAMWFAPLDGALWFESKAKAQKVLNLRRDPRATVLTEAGETYDALRGVSIEGRAEIVDDPEALWRLGVAIWERYTGPYEDSLRPFVESMLRNRVAVRVQPTRVRSWDHRKLGLDPIPLGGTTASTDGE